MSYQKAEQEVAYQTGIRVPAKTQERLVHRQSFPTPAIEQPIEEVCVDGGKVRLRTPLGEPSEWRDYKALETDQGVVANFRNNAQLVDWVNDQPLANPLTCLGDGHDGVWNIIAQVASAPQRREILDWYHLMENRTRSQGEMPCHAHPALFASRKAAHSVKLLADGANRAEGLRDQEAARAFHPHDDGQSRPVPRRARCLGPAAGEW